MGEGTAWASTVYRESHNLGPIRCVGAGSLSLFSYTLIAGSDLNDLLVVLPPLLAALILIPLTHNNLSKTTDQFYFILELALYGRFGHFRIYFEYCTYIKIKLYISDCLV
jgi:hypothetical protein